MVLVLLLEGSRGCLSCSMLDEVWENKRKKLVIIITWVTGRVDLLSGKINANVMVHGTLVRGMFF